MLMYLKFVCRYVYQHGLTAKPGSGIKRGELLPDSAWLFIIDLIQAPTSKNDWRNVNVHIMWDLHTATVKTFWRRVTKL